MLDCWYCHCWVLKWEEVHEKTRYFCLQIFKYQWGKYHYPVYQIYSKSVAWRKQKQKKKKKKKIQQQQQQTSKTKTIKKKTYIYKTAVIVILQI